MKDIKYFIGTLFLALLGCNNLEDQSDAYGNFEAIEVMVSAEAPGRILNFGPGEGDALQQDHIAVVVDSTQLHLKKKQLQTGLASLRSKINTIDAQVSALGIQMENLSREKQRIDNLLAGGAATSKQQDDIRGQILLLEAQIATSKSQKASVYAERKTLDVQIQLIEDQLKKCSVRNPIDGVMLIKFKEEGEMVATGQPLYKMANMEKLILRAYVAGNQLPELEIGNTVTVRFDVSDGMEEVTGVVNWISPRAEFTPKIIQTKEERVNLVYAIKVMVANDGRLKIGMPGEVLF